MNLNMECVDLDNNYDEYERIRFIGVKDDQGVGRKMTQEDAIDFIQKGGSIIWNRRGNYLVVATSPNGKKYVTTDAEGYNSLLDYPKCP